MNHNPIYWALAAATDMWQGESVKGKSRWFTLTLSCNAVYLVAGARFIDWIPALQHRSCSYMCQGCQKPNTGAQVVWWDGERLFTIVAQPAHLSAKPSFVSSWSWNTDPCYHLQIWVSVIYVFWNGKSPLKLPTFISFFTCNLEKKTVFKANVQKQVCCMCCLCFVILSGG